MDGPTMRPKLYAAKGRRLRKVTKQRNVVVTMLIIPTASHAVTAMWETVPSVADPRPTSLGRRFAVNLPGGRRHLDMGMLVVKGSLTRRTRLFAVWAIYLKTMMLERLNVAMI